MSVDSPKGLLTTPYNILFFHLHGDDIQNKLFHHLPRTGSEADWTWLLLIALFEDESDTGYPSVFRHISCQLRPSKGDREWFSDHLSQPLQHTWVYLLGAHGFVYINFSCTGSDGRYSAECKPAVCPGGQDSQWHPGLYEKQCCQQQRKMIIPLFSPGEVAPSVLLSVLGRSLQKRYRGPIQRKAMNMVRTLEHKAYEEWL